jgi:plasmid stabilization system protein ParE
VSIDFTPHAVYDIDTVAEYLETARPGTGTRFRDELQAVLARLERLPQSAALLDPPSTRYPGVRVASVSRFKHYAVFYLPTNDGILVVRILHTSRDATAIFNPDPNPPTPPE